MTVELYYMAESPPCRTVEMIASMAGVKLDLHPINLAEGKHKTPEYTKINPAQKIPFMVDGDLKIGESRAISAYLINKYMPDDNTLYPKEAAKRARIDEALWFDGCNLMQSCLTLLRPLIFGSKTLDKDHEKTYRDNLKLLSDRLERAAGKYLLGDEITLADVSIVAGMTLTEACEYDISEFKTVTAYLDRLKQDIPKYHEINDKAVESMRDFIKLRQGKN